jgi:shikimate dehydrogenase
MDRFAVFGNPVSHSLSPRIHALFAAQTGRALAYEARLVPLGGFAGAVSAFIAERGRGANVTLPFKLEARALATRLSERAILADAVNCLDFRDGGIAGDNTDGAGLTRDLVHNLGRQVADARVLMLGAGGAARGVIAPLLALRPRQLALANRGYARAAGLAARFASLGPIRACELAELSGEPYDLVINATSAGLQGAMPPVTAANFAQGALAYDMVYGAASEAFVAFARRAGAEASDGLGMLVEQAAESFLIWHGVRPETRPVIETLRASRA